MSRSIPPPPERAVAFHYWRRFLKESSLLREYLWKYRRFVTLGILSLLVVDALEVLPPLFLKQAVDIAVEKRPIHWLAWVALGYFGVSILQSLGRYGWRMFLIRASMLAGRDLRGRYARNLFGLSVSFFDRQRIGDLMSLATQDTESVRNMIGSGLLTLADAFLYFVTVPIAMFILSPKLALLAFIPLPIIPWVVMKYERAIHERYEKQQEWFSHQSALIQESLTGIRVTKAFAKEDIQIGRIAEAGKTYMKLNLRRALTQSAFGPTLDFTMSLGLVFLLLVGGHDQIFTASGAVTLGTFVAFQRYIQKMVWPMAALGMALTAYQRSVASSGRLEEIFARKTDTPTPQDPELPKDFSSALTWKTSGAVEFRNLRFRFPGHDSVVLNDISLKVEPGERVAFVGAVGAGKSALLSLLPRLYPVDDGMIFVDGVDINRWPLAELRRQVGYVSQEVFLFSETVQENVSFGLHEWTGNARVISIEEATQLAAVHEDLNGLVNAYQTRLGERGMNLSGGQKQRLTIARALAKLPSILVLDDALSSVDVQTEEKILSGLRSRPGRNTEIIAAHRISTIRDADRIVVLGEGGIRQIGTHAELVTERRGAYRRFYDQQQLREELENYVEGLKT